jgi:hypothetical protein
MMPETVAGKWLRRLRAPPLTRNCKERQPLSAPGAADRRAGNNMIHPEIRRRSTPGKPDRSAIVPLVDPDGSFP